MTGRIVLGLGGTVDDELEWDAGAFQRLVDGHGIRLAEIEDDSPSAVPDERGITRSIGTIGRCTTKWANRSTG